jgi:hypothetical protein
MVVRKSSGFNSRFSRASIWLLLLGRKLYATLAATSRKDGATGTGTHTKAETVGLCATTVVWLESTLSHIYSKGMCEVQVLHRRCHVLVSANL